MKRIGFVVGLVAIFLAGSVFAGNETTQNQGQSAEQAQGQSQWSGGTGSSIVTTDVELENQTKVDTTLSTDTDVENVGINASKQETKIISNVTQRTQPFSPGYGPYPFMFPNEYDYWNGYGSDLAIYERVWTRQECLNILKNAREKGPLEAIACALVGGAQNGFGFKYQVAPLYKYRGPKKNEAEFKLQPPRPVPNDPPNIVEEKWKNLKAHLENLKKFHFGGELGVRGNKDDRVTLQTLAFTMLTAMDNGADYVVGSPGFNPVYHGTSLGTGSGVGTSGVQNSFSFIGGANVGDAKVIGEMIIRATYFQKNGVTNLSPNLSGPERGVQSESKAYFENTPYGVRVSPEVMRKASEPR